MGKIPDRPLVLNLDRIDDRYRIVRELAQGADGVVYEAFDERADQRCAIKVLEGRGRKDAEQAKRFHREVVLGEKLGKHPGVVYTYDSGTLESGELYCVMEFVDGVNLDDKAKAGLPREEAVRLVVQVARAVAFAHDCEVIHRDLKPANVLVVGDGTTRVIDFGVAKALDEIDGLTATGAVMGTISFMSPEQITDSSRIDTRTDVYGLGGVLYVTITGRDPLDLSELSQREALLKIVDMQITPPMQVDPSIDESLNSICMRALARAPDDRQMSAAAFAEELEAWLGGSREVVPLPGDNEDEEDGPTGRAFLLIMAFGVLAVVAMIVYAFLPH